jgi:hypothetical protein
MANMVQRATSHLLGGPDWAMNMELCNLINNDPGYFIRIKIRFSFTSIRPHKDVLSRSSIYLKNVPFTSVQ